MLKVSVEQIVYGVYPPSASLKINSNFDSRKLLLPRVYGSFHTQHINKYSVTTDENDVTNTISFYQAKSIDKTDRYRCDLQRFHTLIKAITTLVLWK